LPRDFHLIGGWEGDVRADKSDAGGRLTRVLAATEKWLGTRLVLGSLEIESG